MKIINSEETENQFLENMGYCVVYFYAPWCTVCGPVEEALLAIEELSDSSCTFYKVNITERPELALNMNVRAVPMLVIVAEGNIKSYRVGLADVFTISSWIDSVIGA